MCLCINISLLLLLIVLRGTEHYGRCRAVYMYINLIAPVANIVQKQQRFLQFILLDFNLLSLYKHVSEPSYEDVLMHIIFFPIDPISSH